MGSNPIVTVLRNEAPPIKGDKPKLESFLRWKVYYEDGSTFDSSQGNPWDAPPYGVMCIGQCYENGETDHTDNGHWYIWRDDLQAWLDIKTQDGMDDQLAHFCRDITAVLFGRTTLRSIYKAAVKRMGEDLRGYR